MTPENKSWLDRLRHHRHTQLQAEFIGHIQPEERKELNRIAREEFGAQHDWCLTCPDELYNLVAFVYSQEEKQAVSVEQPAPGETEGAVPFTGIVNPKPFNQRKNKNNETESKP